MSSTADLLMLARVAGSLVVVLVVVALAARAARRSQWRRSSTGMRVVERTGLTRDASVAVVEVAGRALVLGVTSNGVSVLTTLASDELQAGAAAATPSPDPPSPDPPSPDPLPVTPLPVTPLPVTRPDFDRLLRAAGAGAQSDGSVLPAQVRLGDHPDLAAALKAAGRVTAVPAPRDAEAAAPQRPATGRATGRAAGPDQPAGPDRRARPGPRSTDARPASGSVLDPATWKQGLEALRDLTARRG